jgi:hypothetical protein
VVRSVLEVVPDGNLRRQPRGEQRFFATPA